MTKILNTWRYLYDRERYYEVSEELYRNGDYAAYRLNDSVLYTYKNIAINNLVALNKEHIDALAREEKPCGYGGFVYERAMENKAIGLSVLELIRAGSLDKAPTPAIRTRHSLH